MDWGSAMTYEPGYAYVDYHGVVFRVGYSDGKVEVLALPPEEKGDEEWWRAHLEKALDLACRLGCDAYSWYGANLARGFVRWFGGKLLYSSPTPEQEEWARKMTERGAVF